MLPDSFTHEFKRETKYKATSSRVDQIYQNLPKAYFEK